jgi:hypothetical protein
VTLSAAQVDQLLKPINPGRVKKDGKNFSHIEAHDVRAHLIRIFGFANWSADVTDMTLVFESQGVGDKAGKWTVAYRATVRLTICADNGAVLATYTEVAVGDATNQPSRADAHDLAIKTSESQALKRSATNLGDQFGLSLYNDGSTNALVKGLISRQSAPTVEEGGDDDGTTPTDSGFPRASTAREVSVVAGSGLPPTPSAPKTAQDYADEVLAVKEETGQKEILALTRLLLGAKKEINKLVTDSAGNQVTLSVLINSQIRLRQTSAA